MKAGIIILVLAVAAGLYLVFSTPSGTLTGANLQSLTPAQLLALSPSQLAQLTPSQQATIAALRANPSNYATNPFLSPSPVSSNAGFLTAGLQGLGAVIGGIGQLLNPPAAGAPSTPTNPGITTGPTLAQAGLVPPDNTTVGINTGGTPVGPTYAQAGITPDLPLTAPSPSLIVPINGDPAVIDTGSLVGSGVDYPGIQDYMTDPSLLADTNAYDGTGGAVYT